MKVLFLPNWRIDYVNKNVKNKQSPDVYVKNERYWFFKYWPVTELHVTVIDSGIFNKFEKKFFKIHIIQAIKAFFISHKYDIIISHGGQSALLLAMLRRIFFQKNPPHILIDIAAINGAKTKQPILFITQFASSKIDFIIYHAKMQENHYKKFFPSLFENSMFIHFGIDTNSFNPPKIKKERNYILSFGYCFRDWETLISAYKLLNIDTKLVIIGPDRINIELPHNIILHPSVPVSVLNTLIKNSKFIIIPLTDKQYAHGQMSILQAMAFAKPVITTNIGSIIDYITPGKEALLYELGNAYSLAKKIVELNSDPGLRNHIGMQASLAVKNIYNEERMGRLLWKTAESVLRKAKSK